MPNDRTNRHRAAIRNSRVGVSKFQRQSTMESTIQRPRLHHSRMRDVQGFTVEVGLPRAHELAHAFLKALEDAVLVGNAVPNDDAAAARRRAQPALEHPRSFFEHPHALGENREALAAHDRLFDIDPYRLRALLYFTLPGIRQFFEKLWQSAHLLHVAEQCVGRARIVELGDDVTPEADAVGRKADHVRPFTSR